MAFEPAKIQNHLNYVAPPRTKRPRAFQITDRRTVETFKLPILLFVLHIPLGLLLYNSKALALVHPLAVFLFGMYRALNQKASLERVANVAAYLIGAEILWRMAEAPINWEFGKYASAAIMFTALVRRGLLKIPPPALVYFILLLPACLVGYAANTWGDITAKLSFNMSGPVCLFVSCWFFSHIRLTEGQIKKLLLTATVPLLSVAVTTLFYAVTNPDLEFTSESNYMTSGGFGPNQVSAMLGLGVFISLSAYILFKNDLKTSLVLGSLALFFAMQSVLTFSRGGIYAAAGGLLILGIFQTRDLGRFLSTLVPAAGIVAIFLFFVFPSLNNFTGGKLEERFESSDTTNRLSLMEMEFQIFLDNPILGAGVSRALDERWKYTNRVSASHTEFTRVIAEHGLLGIVSLLALAVGAVHNIRRHRSKVGQAIAAGMVAWSCLFMMSAGMRLAAPAFIWGLSFISLTLPSPRTMRVSRTVKYERKSRPSTW